MNLVLLAGLIILSCYITLLALWLGVDSIHRQLRRMVDLIRSQREEDLRYYRDSLLAHMRADQGLSTLVPVQKGGRCHPRNFNKTGGHFRPPVLVQNLCIQKHERTSALRITPSSCQTALTESSYRRTLTGNKLRLSRNTSS